MARLVTPDAKKISDLCHQRRWGAQELAAAADIAVATAAKVLRGEPCFRTTINLVAEALGKKFIELLEGAPPEQKQEKRYPINLVFVTLKKEDFDDDRIQQFAKKLKEAIDGSGDIDMEDLKGSSVILTLSLTAPDLLRLLAKIIENKQQFYTELGISDLQIDMRDIMDAFLAALNVIFPQSNIEVYNEIVILETLETWKRQMRVYQTSPPPEKTSLPPENN